MTFRCVHFFSHLDLTTVTAVLGLVTTNVGHHVLYRRIVVDTFAVIYMGRQFRPPGVRWGVKMEAQD
jgi:hypothetical protein